MEDKKTNLETAEMSENALESAAGGFGYPDECYKSYYYLMNNRIYFACNKLNVKPYCPKCGALLKLLVKSQMSEEELHAAHERNHIMCHTCHFEGTDNDWVFSPNNHR